VFITMAIASYFNRNPPVYIAVSCVGSFLLIIMGYGGISILTRYVPDTMEAEAIAWLLESSPSQKPSLFKKAGRVANTVQRKAILLNASLRLLPPLIASRLRRAHCEQERSELEMYVAYLAHLSGFPDSPRSLLKNKASVTHPKLPLALMGQLERLRAFRNPLLKDAADAIWRHFVEAESEKTREMNGVMV